MLWSATKVTMLWSATEVTMLWSATEVVVVVVVEELVDVHWARAVTKDLLKLQNMYNTSGLRKCQMLVQILQLGD